VKFLLPGMTLMLAGCSVGVTASDRDQVKQEMSQSRYEAAMKKAGRGEELKKEKEADKNRGETH